MHYITDQVNALLSGLNRAKMSNDKDSVYHMLGSLWGSIMDNVTLRDV